jgi:two-component system response regulator FlrC
VGISPGCYAALQEHSWPGNVRELQNVIERAVILCSEGGMLEAAHLGFTPQANAPRGLSSSNSAGPPPSTSVSGDFYSLAQLEKCHILAAMERCQDNRTAAAKILGISIRTLRNKLNEYKYKGPEKSAMGDD